MTKRTLSAVAAASALALLAACGGGGDGEASGSTSLSAPTTPVVVEPSVETIVQASAYTSGSEEALAYEFINAERLRCGFGTLRQNAALDRAARSHADWMLTYSIFSHYETQDRPQFFTGITPYDRIVAAGYTPIGGTEIIGFGTTPSTTGRGVRGLRELLATPYHGYGALMPARDIGLSVRSPLDLGRNTLLPVTIANIAASTSFQLIASNDVVTYPCDGTTGVDYKMGQELPNPVPNRNLTRDPLGHAVTIMVRFGNILSIDSATMVNSETGANIPLRPAITASNDPNGLFARFGRHAGYVIPDVPLDINSEYEVRLTGTNNGQPFEKQFRFSTGSEAAAF